MGKTVRIQVRGLGTEPVIRVMTEDKNVIDAMADELCELIRRAD